jgi:hypothetical protein
MSSLARLNRTTIATILCLLPSCGFSAPQDAANPRRGAERAVASKTKNPTADDKPKPASVRVDGVQPLFLDPSTESQDIRILGSFWKVDDLDLQSSDNIGVAEWEPVTSDKALPPTEIDATISFKTIPGTDDTVEIKIVSKSANQSISALFHVRPACKPPENPEVGPSLEAPGGSKACTVPEGKYGVDAMTKALTSKTDPKFCTSEEVASDFDIHATYLNPKQSIALVVCNKNPFNYSTALVVDEQPIQDDDLSTFLGILDPMLGATQAAKTATSTAANSTTAKTQKSAHNAAVPTPHTFRIKDSIQACLSNIVQQLNNVDQDYTQFLADYVGLKANLEDDSIECNQRLTGAQSLWTKASDLVRSPKLRNASQSITILLSEINQRVAIATASEYKGSDVTQQQIVSLNAAKEALTTQSCIAQKTASLIYQNVELKVLDPLGKILGKRDAFVYIAYLGPYQQPTQVNWTVRSQSIDKSILPSPSELSGDPYQDCLAQQGNSPSKPAKQTNPQTSDSVVSNKVQLLPVSFSYGAPQAAQPTDSTPQSKQTNKKGNNTQTANNTQNNDTNNSTGSQTQPKDAATTGDLVRSGALTFGGPRFIVSAGIAGVTLGQKQFQKGVGQALDATGKPIPGQSTANIIEYQNNDAFRISPLIMAHTRLYSYRGSDRAIWATLGVTGKSDTSGVSPEYLFGVSQSFWNNWLFLTGGLYVGRKESLSSGLYVGQTVPSNLTGSIPFQNNYKAGFGLALSFRIPKTDAPKTKSTASGTGSTPSPSKKQ